MNQNSPPPTDEAIHILVVDDDRRIRDLLSRYLGENGFRVSVAADAKEARNKINGLDFDLAIVDVMMPGESGIELTRSLNDKPQLPILMLTALSETDQRVEGLEAGADDYLGKPFEPRELLLRINNIVRRTAKKHKPVIEFVRFGPYEYDVKKGALTKDGNNLRLTDREQEIMNAFAARPGDTVARHELLGNDADMGERKIDVQINRLRRKIESDPSDPQFLQTVRGVGYKLCAD